MKPLLTGVPCNHVVVSFRHVTVAVEVHYVVQGMILPVAFHKATVGKWREVFVPKTHGQVLPQFVLMESNLCQVIPPRSMECKAMAKRSGPITPLLLHRWHYHWKKCVVPIKGNFNSQLIYSCQLYL